MSSDRWVRIVDPEHVYRAGIDEVWRPVLYPQRWSPVDGIADGKFDVRSPYRVRCRLRDVPPGTEIVDPGPDHELLEPWVAEPAGDEEYWSESDREWRKRTGPHLCLVREYIYRRPIAKPAHKTPQPGEWWFEDDGADRVFIHGINVKGLAVCELEHGGVSTDDDWRGWHHEPACTGWDWQPPQPEAKPEELQTYNITVSITDREREVLLRLSGVVDLPPERVMIQALRHYQTVIEPVNPLTLALAKFEAEPEPLTLGQRVEALEERLKKLEHQVSELEDSQ